MNSGHTPPVGAGPPIELVVTSGGDSTNPSDGVLTLREAVADQATAGVSARITFAPGIDEVVLTQGELLVNGTSVAAVLTIDGGAGGLTLTQDVAGGSRVVHVDGATNSIQQAVVLKDLTITGGGGTTNATSYGAGLLGQTASITLDDVTVTGNHAAGGTGVAGGGLALNHCTTTITGGAITDNSVVASTGYGSGGGIFAAYGSLSLSGTQVSGNSATGNLAPVFGGGIALVGLPTFLDHTIVEQNKATLAGGTGYAAGGGISAIGQNTGQTGLTLNYVTLRENTAKGAGSAYGGGLFGTLKVDVFYSLVTANAAEASAKAFGGGIATAGFSTNVSIGNSTITGNTLDAARGYGAGVESNNSVVQIFSTTIVGNSVGDAPGVGGIDMSRASGATAIANSIIAQNIGTTTDVSGTIASDGHNLFSQLDIFGQQPGDIVTLDAKLSALAANGGPTLTMALLDGSPALDAGSDADAVGSTDQRGTGFLRISGEHTDIGAFERQVLGGVERLFTPGDDVVDLRGVDLALFPGALGTQALAGNDTVHLSPTQNVGRPFLAGKGDDVVIGSAAGDRIAGQAGDDVLIGGARADVLRGGSGNDILNGRRGLDELHGGAGADRFVYSDASHAPPGRVGIDEILDFSRREGDRIDLRQIDTTPGVAGDQHFTFVGRGPLDEVGDLRARALGDGDFLVSGQLDRDASPEFSILVCTEDNLGRLERGDFLL